LTVWTALKGSRRCAHTRDVVGFVKNSWGVWRFGRKRPGRGLKTFLQERSNGGGKGKT